MGVDWSLLIDHMEISHLSAWYSGEDVDGHVAKAWAAWTAGNDHSCLYWTLFGVDDLQYVTRDITYRYIWGENGFSMMIPTAFRYLKEQIDAMTVSMDAILSAMLTAEPNQVQYFVGLVDAYRQSVWNKPFNQEFFAALARGFAEWP